MRKAFMEGMSRCRWRYFSMEGDLGAPEPYWAFRLGWQVNLWMDRIRKRIRAW